MRAPKAPAPRKLFVEGGGDKNPSLASECRKAFSKLFEKAGVSRKPRVVACGGRQEAYKEFCDALATGTDALLLVDAEALPATSSPWQHVKTRVGDGWARPSTATEDHLHLMTVCMEAWLAADVQAMRKIFGPKFDASKLPQEPSLERTEKIPLYRALDAAISDTPAGKRGYEELKGSHSFRVLAEVAPERLRELTWAKRFLDAMGKAR